MAIKKTNKDFGEALEELRTKAGLSYESMALGMSYNPHCGNKDRYRNDSWTQHYCKYRAGKIPKESIIKEFADFFEISPHYFFEYRLLQMLRFLNRDRRFLDRLEKLMSKYKGKGVDI